MKNSLTFKRAVLTLLFSVAILLLALAIILVFGIKSVNNVPTALAEKELATALTYSFDEEELVVTKITEGDFALWGDAEFEISSARGEGETLIAVYATYTSGEFNGEKVALDYIESTNHFILYGVLGDFTLTGEWVATWFEPVWTYNTSQCTVTSEMPTRVQVGIGLPLEEMPSVDGTQLSTSMYYSDGWSVTGTLKDGNTYSLGYIPVDAISAMCTAKLTDATTYVYYTTKDVKDSTRPTVVGEGVFNKDYNKSNGTPVGVYAAGDTKDPYSGIDATVNTSGTKYRYGFLGHASNDGSGRPYNKRLDEGCTSTFTNDAGATEYYNGMGFYREKTTRSSTAVYDHSMLVIPIRFDDALKRDLLAGVYSSVKVTITARILVGAKNVSSNARTNAWLDLEEGIKPRLTDFSYSGNDASVTGYPRTLINGEWKTDLSYAHNSSTNPAAITSDYISATSWGVKQGVYSRTIQTSATSGFTVGFRATYYTNSGNGVTKHFALINTLVYTIEAIDANGNSTVGQRYTVNLNENAPDGAIVQESVKADTANTITATSLDSSMQLDSVPWAYEGYEFTGWSTDSSATIGDKDLVLEGTMDGSLTYYAIWQKKKYEYLEYDVYYDESKEAGLIRKDANGDALMGIYEHGATVSLSLAADGGNSYIGFGDPATKSILGVAGARANWTDWGEEATFSIDKPIVIGFVREMKEHNVTLTEGTSVSYGNTINLNDFVTYTHELDTVIFANSWLNDIAEEGTFEYRVFEGEYALTQVLESGNYKFESIAKVVIESVLGDIELSKTIVTDATTFTITPVELNVVWLLDGEEEYTTTYTGLGHVMSVDITGEVLDEEVIATLTNESQIVVGSYTAQIASINSTNYVYDTENLQSKDYEIKPAELTITWLLDGQEETETAYTGTAHEMTVAFGGIVNNEELIPTLTNNFNTVVGTYTATIESITNISNYTYDESLNNKDYAITAVELVVTWTLDSEGIFSVEYNGLERVMGATLSGTVNDEVVTATIINNVETNAGGYIAEIESIDSDNYVLAESDKTKEFFITPVVIAPVWALDGIEANSLIYDGNEHEVVASVSNIIGVDVVNLTYDGILTATDKGDYNVIITQIDNANYTLEGAQDLSFAWSILGLNITASWTSGEYVYNGAYQYPTLMVGGFESADEVSFFIEIYKDNVLMVSKQVTGSGNEEYLFESSNASHVAGESIDVGVYEIRFNGIVYDVNGVEMLKYNRLAGFEVQGYEIAKKTINGTGVWHYEVAGGGEGVYGSNTYLEYVKAPYTLSTTLDESELVAREDNGVLDEVPTIQYENNVNTNAGEYQTVITIDSINYQLGNNDSLDWSISPKEVGISWRVNGMTDLAPVFNGEAYNVSAIVEGVVAGDSCSATLSDESITNAIERGDYFAKISTLSNGNYVAPENSTVTWSIMPLPVSVVWNNVALTYNGEKQGISATVSNIKGNYNCEFTYEDNAYVDAGNYKAYVVGVTSDNYTLDGATGLSKEWSIDPKEVSIVWTIEGDETLVKTYRASAFTISAVAQGIVGSDECEVTIEGDKVKTYVGDYTAKAVSVSNDNYVLSSVVTTEWSIAPLKLSLGWSETQFTYDGIEKSVVATAKNLASSNDSLFFTYENNKATNAGEYEAKVLTISNSNYTLEEVNTAISWTIAKKALTPVWYLDGVQERNNVTYDSGNHVATATLEGVVDGENVTIIGYTGEVISGVGDLTDGNEATLKATYLTTITSISDNNNYVLSSEGATFEWSISAIQLGVEFLASDFIYNGEVQCVTAIVSNIAENDLTNGLITILIEGSTTTEINYDVMEGNYYLYFGAVNSGDYTIVLSGIQGEHKDNYELPTATSYQFNIAPKALAFDWIAENNTYSKSNKVALAVPTNIVGTDILTIEYKTTGANEYEVNGYENVGNVAMNVGLYQTEIIGVDDINYTLAGASNISTTWSIEAKEINEITWENTIVNYNANAQSVIATVLDGASSDNDGKAYAGDSLTLSYEGIVSENYGLSEISGNTATNAGEYFVKVVGLGNSNYYVNDDGVDFQIQKAMVVVSTTSNWSKTYDKSVAYSSYEYVGAIESTDIVLSAEYASCNAGATTLTFNLDGVKVANYSLTFEGLTLDQDYEINGSEYVLSDEIGMINAKSVNVMGETEKVFDGTTDINEFAVLESDVIEGDVINVSGAYTTAVVGVSNINLQIDNTNYVLVNDVLEGEIMPKALFAEWTNQDASYVYNGALQGVSVNVSGMVAGYEEEIVYSNDLVAKNAGRYSVQISLGASSNYTLNGAQTSANWEIAKKALGVNWVVDSLGEADNSDYVYGFKEYVVTYSAIARFVEPVVIGVVDGDVVDYIVTGTEQTNVGIYTAKITDLSGADKDNYELPGELTCNWEIVRSDILGVTMESDTFTYDNSLSCIGVNTMVSQFGEALTVSYSGGEEGNGAVNAGTYEIVASVEGGDNYNALVLNATLVIEKAYLEGITIQNVTVIYDGSLKSIVLDTTTTAFGDSVEAVYSISGTTCGGREILEEGNGIKTAGSYEISAFVSAGNNYYASTLTAQLVIEAREIAIDWSSFVSGDSGSVYDGLEKGVTISISNIVTGDDVKAILSKDNGAKDVEINGNGEYSYGAVNAGAKYVLTLEEIVGADIENYTYNCALPYSSSFGIDRRPLTVVGWSDGENVYNNLQDIRLTYAKKTFTLNPIFAEGNILNGDELDLNLSGNEGINAGEYTISLAINGISNYVLSTTTQQWHIEAKEVDLVWDKNVERVYNGAVQTITASVVGFLGDDVANIKYSSNSGKDAGVYNITATSLDNENYKISTKTKKQSLIINPASITGIELVDKEVVFDGKSHSLELSNTETQFGDSIKVSYEFFDAKGDKVKSGKVSEAGDYTVIATLSAGKNYLECTLEGTLTIRSLSITTTPSEDDGKEEDKKKPAISVESEEGFKPGTVVETTITNVALTETYSGKVRLGARERVSAVYQISMLYNNEESTLNGSATIKMEIPEELRGSNFRIVNVVDGEEVEVEYVVEGDTVSVVTENLDTFLFIYEPTPKEYAVAYAGWIALAGVIFLLIIVAIIAIAFFTKERTIKFVSNGVAVEGNSIRTLVCRFGQEVDLPEPTKKTMYFKGWYNDEECSDKVTCDPHVLKNGKLYAKNVGRGSKAKIPQEFMDGLAFEGWYEDEACTKKANVKRMGRKNITLYAKWGKKRDTKKYPWEL